MSFVRIQGSECNACSWNLNGGSRQVSMPVGETKSHVWQPQQGRKTEQEPGPPGRGWQGRGWLLWCDHSRERLRFGGRQGDERSSRKQNKTNLKLNFFKQFYKLLILTKI